MQQISTDLIADATTAEPAKLVTFHRFIPQARLPMRADRSAMGAIPTRAFRYCEAIVTANSFGYYVFPRMNFTLMFDGAEITWNYEGGPGFQPLRVAQFPNFREHFDAVAPEDCREFSPPFIGSLHEPGMIQLWSGLVARTRPGWSLLVRAPANVPNKEAFEVFEGVVETDRWFGPLFSAVQLTRTNTPIEFRADYPLFQVQPIPREALDDRNLNDYELVPELSQLSPADWDEYYDTVVRPNIADKRPRGQYAKDTRKRRASEE